MRIACYIRCDNVFNEIQGVLARAHFECERFQSEIPLLRRLRRQGFDLILVDTEGDPLDEKRIYSWLNCRTGETTPVVLLSSAYCARTIALSLEAGADDFINRPVEPDVLIARLHAVVRRSSRKTTRRLIEMLDFTLDKDACRLLNRGVPVELTPREFAMAWLLFSSPGTFLSRETISVAIWGVECEIARHTIEQHVYKLRKKLSLGAERGVQIRTAYTKGYCLEVCERVAMPA
ncbi:MAG: two-component system, OmpR family, response regulator QseB [Burkholderiales bacterium]|jgi:DNA-binding response OmpR family regulator